MQKKGNKKRLWIIWSILGIVLVFGGAGVAGAIHYVNQVPKITAREFVEVKSGETLSLSDLAEITCKGKYTVRLEIAETNVNSAKVLEEELKAEGDGTKQEKDASKPDDGMSHPALYVGDEAGYVRLMINVAGYVAELVGENVTIYVKPGEAEQEQILKEAEDQFVKIKEYLEENDFSDQKEALTREIDKEAFLQAQGDTEKVKLIKES